MHRSGLLFTKPCADRIGVEKCGGRQIPEQTNAVVQRSLHGEECLSKEEKEHLERHFLGGFDCPYHHHQSTSGRSVGSRREEETKLSEDGRFSCSLLIPRTFPEHLQRVRPCAIQAGN